MEGVNSETSRGKYFKALIDNLNTSIENMKEAGLQILDADNFDSRIAHVRYCPAQDNVIVEFERAVEEE